MKRNKKVIIGSALAALAVMLFLVCREKDGIITIDKWNKEIALTGEIGFPDKDDLPLNVSGIISVDKGKLTEITGTLYERYIYDDADKKTIVYSVSEKVNAKTYDLSEGKVGKELERELNEALSKVPMSGHYASKIYYLEICAKGTKAAYQKVLYIGEQMYLPTPTVIPSAYSNR